MLGAAEVVWEKGDPACAHCSEHWARRLNKTQAHARLSKGHSTQQARAPTAPDVR